MSIRISWIAGGFLLTLAPALAAVDGTVVNGTTGKPAGGVSISLVEPGQEGMKALGQTTSDDQGKFSLSQTPKGPGLLQATYAGVTYTKMMMPGAPSAGLSVAVYDATRKPVAKVSQHMLLFQPTGSSLNINETFLVEGDPKLTFNDPDNGTLRLYLPPDVKGELMAQVTFGANGVPVQRRAEKTKQANIYMVNYPMRPGETRVDLTYSVPASTPAVFSGKILHSGGKTRLVVPNGVSLKGAAISEVGKEPRSQATIYDVNGDNFEVEVTGTGALEAPEAGSDEDNGAPQIQQIQPHIYDKMYWIMGLAFAILGLGSFLLARHTQPSPLKK